MQVVSEKTEKPLIKLLELEDPVKDSAVPFMQPHEYEIIAEVGQGIALPAAHKYNIKIKLADFELQTEKPVYVENTYNRWNTRFQKTVYTSTY